MKTLLTAAVLTGLALIFVGGVACVVVMPAWVCALYGLMASVNVLAALDTVGRIWAAGEDRPPNRAALIELAGRGELVEARTYADPDRGTAAKLARGRLRIRRQTNSDWVQCLVGGVLVNPETIRPLVG